MRASGSSARKPISDVTNAPPGRRWGKEVGAAVARAEPGRAVRGARRGWAQRGGSSWDHPAWRARLKGAQRRGPFWPPVKAAPAGALPISRSSRLRPRGTASCSRPPSSGPPTGQLPGLGMMEPGTYVPRPLIVGSGLRKGMTCGGIAGGLLGGGGIELPFSVLLLSYPVGHVGLDSLRSVLLAQPEPLPGPLPELPASVSPLELTSQPLRALNPQICTSCF